MNKEVKITISTDKNCRELALFNKALIDDGGSINAMSLEELENRMREFITSGFVAMIFEVENIHIGYALIDTNKTPFFIRQFFIGKEFRRRGYGRTAFSKIVEYFNTDQLDLTVLCNNEIAYKFWINCGLVPYETILHYRK